MASNIPFSASHTGGDRSTVKIYGMAAADTQAKIDALKKKNEEFAAMLRPILEEVLKVAPEDMFGHSPTLKEATFLPDDLPKRVDEVYPEARFLICGREKGWFGYKEPETNGEFNAWCFNNDGQYKFVLEKSSVNSREKIANIGMSVSKTDRSFQTGLRDRLVRAVAKYSVMEKDR